MTEVELQDSGEYVCGATSKTGQSYWPSSYLTVTDLEVITDEKTYAENNFNTPSEPSGLKLINVTDSTVSMSWRPIDDENSLISYLVEYWTVSLSQDYGWIRIAKRFHNNFATIKGLKPRAKYFFLVRSETVYGLSVPSILLGPITTISDDQLINNDYLESARNVLSLKIVDLYNAKAISPTAIHLQWSLSDRTEFLEGFYIRFREISDLHNYSIVTILDVDKKSFTLSHLRKFTNYEIFITPFYKSIEGQPSNSRVCRTDSDLPSYSPDNIIAGLVNETLGWIRWSPLPLEFQNGK